MLGNKGLFITVCLIAFVGSLIAVSFTFENASAAADDERFDLAAALDNAEGGDVILMDSDAVLSRDATVKPGVKLDDGGFAISIETYAKLSVSGEFVSSGNLTVDFRGSVSVTSDGVMSIDNKGNAAIVTGSLEIYKDGVIRIGMHESSTLECPANGRLMVEGTMILGYGTLNSSVDVRTATVTGTLQISDGSSFRVTDSLTVGSAPTLITDMKNTASVTGKVTLADSAYVLVYGESSFGSGNIKYRAVSTQFILNGIYATEYKDNTGKRTIVLPSTSGLKDCVVSGWLDSNKNVITPDTTAQIGSIGALDAEREPRNYTIVLANDPSIRWVVGGIDKGSSAELVGVYGSKMTIGIRLASGHTELPTIKMDGVPYNAGTSFTVTGDTTFTTSNNYPEPRESIVPILLIILAILVVVLAIFLVALRSRNSAEK